MSKNSGPCPPLPAPARPCLPLPATAPTPTALEDILVERTREQRQDISSCLTWAWRRDGNRPLLRFRQGAEGRVGLHTCTQLEGLTLALLLEEATLSSPTYSPPWSHLPTRKDPLRPEVGLCRTYGLGAVGRGQEVRPWGWQCSTLVLEHMFYCVQNIPSLPGSP